VGPINTNAREINGKLSAVDSVVKSIEGDGSQTGVSAINRRAMDIIALTTAIDNDLTNVDNLVASIDVSAKSICNATLLVSAPCP
jgi:6-phosphofructokinase